MRDDPTEPRQRWAAWLGGLASIAIAALLIAGVVIWAQANFAAPGYVFMRGPAPLAALLLSTIAQAAAGLVLVVRRPNNRVGWIIIGFALVVALGAPITAATAGSHSAPASEPVRWLAWAASWLIFPGGSFLAAYLGFVFPDGRLPSPRWRNGLALVAGAVVLAGVAVATRSGPLVFFPTMTNPVIGIDLGVGHAAYPILILLALAGLSPGVALAARYRVSDPIAQLQIRWYVAAGVALAVGYAAFLAALVLLKPFDPLGEAILTVFYLILSIPPVAMTIAILRYRLYDIDTIISRAFVFGALTAVLAGVYAASIRLFNALFTAITGEDSDLALVITTLILATTFTPIKNWLERIVEGRVRPGQESPETAQLLADPAFVAAVDARIRASVAGDSPHVSSPTSSKVPEAEG